MGKAGEFSGCRFLGNTFLGFGGFSHTGASGESFRSVRGLPVMCLKDAAVRNGDALQDHTGLVACSLRIFASDLRNAGGKGIDLLWGITSVGFSVRDEALHVGGG